MNSRSFTLLLLFSFSLSARSTAVVGSQRRHGHDESDDNLQAGAATVVSRSLAAATMAPIRINCGGSNFTDSGGRQWRADEYFAGGGVYQTSAAIAGTSDDPLYQTERYGTAIYSIPVPAGSYSVVLHFSEIYHSVAGARVFGISVEGRLMTGMDIVKQAGGAFKAYTRSVDSLIVTDGFLSLQLLNNLPAIDAPKLSGIEVKQLASALSPTLPAPVAKAPVMAPPPVKAPVATFSPILINCGGLAPYTDSKGRVWSADRFFTGGAIYADVHAVVHGTADGPLYNCERNGAAVYQIPVLAGTYTVTLHLAEVYHTLVGQRVFDLDVEGQLLKDIDVVKMGSGSAFKAVQRVVSSVVVSDGALTIKLLNNVPAIDLAKLSAIEIHQSSLLPSKAPVPVSLPTRAPTPISIPAKAPMPVPVALAPRAAPLSPVAPTSFKPILINCGGAAYNDTMGRQWRADEYFLGGGVYQTSAAIAGTSDDPLYQTERFGTAIYSVPVPVGNYTVTLHLCEIYHTAVGWRIFDLDVEGRVVSDLDMVKLIGSFTAITRVLSAVFVADGFLTIKLLTNVPAIDLPKLSAIEVAQATSPVAKAPVVPPIAPVAKAPIVPPMAPVAKAPVVLPMAPVAKAPVVPPMAPVAKAPVAPPMAPVAKAPVAPPLAPVARAPTKAPVAKAPVTAPRAKVPTKAPLTPSKAPVAKAPVTAPLAKVPTKAPLAPKPAPAFSPVLINCGGANYTDTKGRKWMADAFYTGGLTYVSNLEVADTVDDSLYNCERFGQSTYEIPLPAGTYTVVLHLAEIFHTLIGNRVFDISVESEQVPDVDIVQIGGGMAFKAVTMVVGPIDVSDGFLTVALNNNVPMIDYPKISAIEVNQYSPAVATLAPTTAPISMRAPVPGSTIAPAATKPTAAAPFTSILISCGGKDYVDTQGRLWMADKFFDGGNTFFNGAAPILGTGDDLLYQSERYGAHSYEIPIPAGDYEAVFHMAELYFTFPRSRIFDIIVEDKVITDIDIVQQAGGSAFRAITRETPVTVTDGFLSITFAPKEPAIGDPKVSAIEIRRVGPHYAHAVTGGPYVAVDSDDNGSALVHVDSSESHTHGPNQVLKTFVWKEGAKVVGNGEVTDLLLPVGVHDITLTVVDSSGDVNLDITTMTVRKAGYPVVNTLSPTSGDIAGGNKVIITGSAIASVNEVRFGLVVLSEADITVLNATAISVKVPASGFGVPVSVSVITPAGESNSRPYVYVSSAPIAFAVEKLLDFGTPTSVAFGSDGSLYVGSTSGQLGRFKLNDSFDKVVSSVVSTIDASRGIHCIAFDPMETAELGVNVNVYISTSRIFHLEYRNSIGDGINGKIQTVKGANLDIVTDVVTGLPVSELDHAVNGIYFGDNGELYIAVGSNTNGGIPGELSATRLMRENYFSAAVLVANMGQPAFDGHIKYDKPIDGSPVAGFGTAGVEVFASGLRNPFGVYMHSNGKVYATENGPNPGFGDMATGCGVGQQVPDAYDVDELNLLKRGGYYGHPNHKRAETDPRQCAWRSSSVPSDGKAYSAPIMKLTSSTDGIIEFESDHFNGQMRGDLILSKYTDGFFRVILSPDGETVNRSSDPAIPLTGDNGLAVAQGPDGTLVDARYTTNNCYFFKPIEAPSTVMDIKSVFPRRGALVGGSKLWIFGVNFVAGTAASPLVVTVGGKACTQAVVLSSKKIECTLPMHTVGKKDVVVTNGAQKDTFKDGYRYITGKPAAAAVAV